MSGDVPSSSIATLGEGVERGEGAGLARDFGGNRAEVWWYLLNELVKAPTKELYHTSNLVSNSGKLSLFI